MPGPSDYVDGTYLQQNPDWHVADSSWKVQQIHRILNRNQVLPKTIYEAGCGAGEILRLLQQSLDPACELWGADVSPHAIELCQARADEKLHFALLEDQPWEGKYFDLVMAIDVLAHIEDYRGFLRKIKSRGAYKLIHIPLGHFGAARSAGEQHDPPPKRAPTPSLFFQAYGDVCAIRLGIRNC